MNGVISLKPSFPMYNTRLRSNKIMKQGKTTFTPRIISNKIDRILPTFSKVHIASISPVLASTKQLLKHPFLHHVIVPVAGTIASMAAVWVILPMQLWRFHIFVTETIFLPLGLGSVAYEKSLLGALEVTVKYPVSVLIVLRTLMVIAPTTMASLTFPVIWRVALKLSILLFFHQLKRNVITRIVDSRNIVMRDKLLVVDKWNSVAMLSLGGIVICDALGDAAQTILENLFFATSFLMAITIVDNHKAQNSFKGIVYQSPDEGIDMVAKVTAEHEN